MSPFPLLHRAYRQSFTPGILRPRLAMARVLNAQMIEDHPGINAAMKALQTTLIRWREEVLNYFDSGLTNAVIEVILGIKSKWRGPSGRVSNLVLRGPTGF